MHIGNDVQVKFIEAGPVKQVIVNRLKNLIIK